MAEPEDERQRVVVHQPGELLGGQRLGDRRLRLSRAEPQSIPVREQATRRTTWNPALVFLYGFAAIILLGALLLSLPFATADGRSASFLTALFTATSAVCVTGLVVVDTGTYWSGFGHAMILLLIQLGGFGFMTSSTFLFLLLGRQITIREHVLLSEVLGTKGLETALTVVRGAFFFTVIAEAIGVVLLLTAFLGSMDPPRAIWWAVFHSISAFNNAGFDLTGGFQSLTAYHNNPLVLLTVAGLVILGGISFAVVADLLRRRMKRLTLDTKLVLWTTGILLLLGTLGVLFTERANSDTLGDMTFGHRLLNAFFLTASGRTAGFSAFDIGGMTGEGLLILMSLMFIGGAAASTAGGIKVQTFSLLLFAIISVLRGSSEVIAFQRRVPLHTLLRALTVALLTLALVFLTGFALGATQEFALLHVLFEAFSAVGTVGLSTGITRELSAFGQLIVIPIMFIGRLGPLTLVFALAARERRPAYRWMEEEVKIG